MVNIIYTKKDKNRIINICLFWFWLAVILSMFYSPSGKCDGIDHDKVFYEKALAALEGNMVKTLPSVYFVCPTCGNTYDNAAPTRCGISMTGGNEFIKMANLNS